MEEKQWTTITLSPELKDKLQSKKIHPNQSYQEVIQKLLKKGEKECQQDTNLPEEKN